MLACSQTVMYCASVCESQVDNKLQNKDPVGIILKYNLSMLFIIPIGLLFEYDVCAFVFGW